MKNIKDKIWIAIIVSLLVYPLFLLGGFTSRVHMESVIIRRAEKEWCEANRHNPKGLSELKTCIKYY